MIVLMIVMDIKLFWVLMGLAGFGSGTIIYWIYLIIDSVLT